MIKPVLDQDFKPAIIELRKFNEEVSKEKEKGHIAISIERNNGLVYKKELDCFKDGVNDEWNIFIIERIIKSILWIVGGYKVYIAGSDIIYNAIKKQYSKNGKRKFDYEFMSNVYENEFEVIKTTFREIKDNKELSISCGGYLDGRRIGFDAGGSDRKCSAVVNGEVIYSEEVLWFPKENSDPKYHIEGIYEAFKTAVHKMGGDCDYIGVSSAGVYIDNKAMVASLFIKVGKEDFNKYCKTIYIDCKNRLEKELGHEIPIIVANDGDVTALAGAMDLKTGSVLGIAMGTSEAVGYVNKDGNLTGWLSELAFAPVDFNQDNILDEWSGDYGVGCKYFSQDAVIKLANKSGIVFEEGMSLANKLKFVQKLNDEGNDTANKIFESIGVYLAYELMYYKEFYDIKNVLILGRVTSGKGGDTILNVCKETLRTEFPEANIEIGMPSEYMRRVGQSIAAASLPKTK